MLLLMMELCVLLLLLQWWVSRSLVPSIGLLHCCIAAHRWCSLHAYRAGIVALCWAGCIAKYSERQTSSKPGTVDLVHFKTEKITLVSPITASWIRVLPADVVFISGCPQGILTASCLCTPFTGWLNFVICIKMCVSIHAHGSPVLAHAASLIWREGLTSLRRMVEHGHVS